jgi:DNA-binding NarL/FixJ family response regulator
MTTKTEMQYIVIIEDNSDLLEAYKVILNSLSHFCVVGTYTTCEEALKSFKKDSPDIVLIDISLPGMNGIQGIREIKKIRPQTKIMVISVHDDSPSIFDALCAGAIGYITKDSSHHELVKAVEDIISGGAPMSTRIANMVVKSFHLNPVSPLTEREQAVLQQLSMGKTYSFIAQELNISKDTVKTHIQHIYDKLQVNNKDDALIKARRDNLVKGK